LSVNVTFWSASVPAVSMAPPVAAPPLDPRRVLSPPIAWFFANVLFVARPCRD